MRNKGTLLLFLLLAGTVGRAMHFGEWSQAFSVESIAGTDPSFNTAFQDGCPAPSRDGLSIFMASNRIFCPQFLWISLWVICKYLR